MSDALAFILRPFRKADAAALAKYANNAKIADNLRDGFPHPYRLKDAEAFIAKMCSSDPVNVFAIVIHDEVTGGIGLHQQTDIYRKNMELGYWLAEKYWGNGIISRAIPEIVAYGFQTFDINRIYACPYGSNLASQRVLEKNGFILEARIHDNLIKNDRYEDELIYAVRRRSFHQPLTESILISTR